MKTKLRRSMWIIPLACMLFASNLFAHAVVFPKRAAPGTYEKYVLRVPNERNVVTTRVEIRFPADVKVVSFADVAGWSLEVMTDSAQHVTGAVWTGKLAPQRFIEFPFVAVNPKTAAQLVWPAFQTYADGERVEWTGAEGSDKPASVTSIAMDDQSASGVAGAAGGPGGGGVGAGASSSDAEAASGRTSPALPAALLALVIAMVALGLALRNKRQDV